MGDADLAVDGEGSFRPRCALPRSATTLGLLVLLSLALVTIAVMATGPLHWQANRSSGKTTMKVLFVGNSFTYGPAPLGQKALNNLPGLFRLIANSLGNQVEVGEDTIGGCTLDAHRPSRNPEGCESQECALVDNQRVNQSAGCTVSAGVRISDSYHPCPQLFTRRDWDLVLIQDFSAMASVAQGRDTYLIPAISEYVRVAALQEHKPRIGVYMTWSYPNGSTFDPPRECPTGSKVSTTNCTPNVNYDPVVHRLGASDMGV